MDGWKGYAVGQGHSLLDLDSVHADSVDVSHSTDCLVIEIQSTHVLSIYVDVGRTTHHCTTALLISGNDLMLL